MRSRLMFCFVCFKTEKNPREFEIQTEDRLRKRGIWKEANKAAESPFLSSPPSLCSFVYLLHLSLFYSRFFASTGSKSLKGQKRLCLPLLIHYSKSFPKNGIATGGLRIYFVTHSASREEAQTEKESGWSLSFRSLFDPVNEEIGRWLMGLPTSSKSGQKQSKTPKFLKNVRRWEEVFLLCPCQLPYKWDTSKELGPSTQWIPPRRYFGSKFGLIDDCHYPVLDFHRTSGQLPYFVSTIVSYETVKTSIRRGFGACTGEGGHHIVKDYLQLLETNAAPSGISRVVFSLLDNMNNYGLFLLANILSGSSVKFEKTRWKMKKYIKEYLPKILRDQNHKGRQMGLLKQLSQLLKDPHNFRENHVTLVTPISHSHCSAVTELLKGLEDMPFQTLNAMHRRLKGVRGGVPQLQPPRSGWNRNRLIKQVKMTWEKMLSEHDEGGELQVPLAKAMAVASLSFKVTTGYQNPSLMEFHHFSPEIEALQNEILNAIWLLKEKVRSSELKDVLLLLDPDANFSNGVVRTSVRKMLIEYLFECSEMDSIPKSLLETLAMINRSSRSALSTCISKEEAEEELECVLSVSGQIKQIVWDLVPDHEFDQDFTDAYMEDLEESDDDENQLELSNIQISKSHSHNSNDQVESIGESLQIDSILPTPTSNGNCSSELSLHNTRLNGKSIDGSKTEQFIGLDSGDLHVYGFSSSFQESSILHEKQNMKGNHYLSIQEVCDETSMVAHQLTGRLLEEFAQIEGLDLDRTERSYLRGGNSNPGDFQDEMQTSSKDDLDGPLLVRIIEELIPSLPKRESEGFDGAAVVTCCLALKLGLRIFQCHASSSPSGLDLRCELVSSLCHCKNRE
ncbi:hypothetical protein HHK36_019928 [Tetracentron sinense]|uniref:Uncharacterized protein n=1 Tax=Tetracentron sinense TaxID=13715 RepID=A0A834YU33_TETSI|nr:hypothetical protein HHK36_019928 [Tetracentron sinense]